ncbi:MAG: GNAT family N-acetyltransferase [Clostridia bacterium]|nr:GNAT family N-acetyltransferase [Clostridia bacterium]
MKTYVKRFDELTLDELYEILKIRVNVFVVEQNCPYSELDDVDKDAFHVYLKDAGGMQAYLRVYKKNGVRIGRVLSLKRRQGLGTTVLNEGIRVAKEKLSAKKIVIEAQTYARKMYENAGFVQTSEAFLEDGIEHIRMELKI